MYLQNLENLGRLNLSNNNMEHFPIEISLLTDLVEFHFDQSSGRKIEELPKEVGNSTLFHLYLDNNAISELPDTMVKVGPTNRCVLPIWYWVIYAIIAGSLGVLDVSIFFHGGDGEKNQDFMEIRLLHAHNLINWHKQVHV